MGAKPYKTGMPKCRNFKMTDSPKYPGLCKQFDENEVEHNVAGNEYVDLEFNSINGRDGNTGGHYTYKTFNGELESSKRRNNVIIVPVPSPSPTKHVSNRNYHSIVNNEEHSFVKCQKHSHSFSELSRAQQYATNGQQTQPNYQKNQQMTPFLQAFHLQHQQHAQKRLIDRTNPFQTYRWDQLFRNNNHV